MSNVSPVTGEVIEYDDNVRNTPEASTLRTELSNLNAGGDVHGFYSSMKATSIAERIAVAKALSSSEAIVDTILGKPVNVVDLIIQAADMINEQTKQMQVVPRVVLVTDDGKAYHAISGPLYRDVTNLLGIVGEPSSWGEPVVVSVKREGSGNRRYFTMDVHGLLSEVEQANADAAKSGK
ncbi:ssDNA binding protein [Curtobacterium phage Pize]|uniref:ssDNA binding protein n=1 Tax=Curtobacterium phage Pize TaxID=2851068 RepID=UPI002201A520|nr:ssDNA binding protein [Curtobacterium phage Pize]QXG07733.1 ssDNA binding protein [Curtobacterium phage Pize]